MLKSHERFYTKNGKRLILVVDDEAVNRELLAEMLRGQYEILCAADGREALDLIRAHSELLSLVILDLMMPVLSGIELLRILKREEQLQRIPVIVLTAEKSMEVESLRLGASDFIAKPYEMPAIILARVQRTIELAEDRYIIQTTERDELTQLLNREFFYRYIEQFDMRHSEAMDAVTVDISSFRLVNELHGRAYGDTVLRRLGRNIMEYIAANGGVAGRENADTFLLYLPAGADYDALSDALSAGLSDAQDAVRLHLRVGVYPCADRALSVERRFDRARLAGDRIRDDYTHSVSVYDRELHQRDLRAQQLIDDMDRALREKQFRLCYQPKFDVTGDRPALCGAEALVRWDHPTLGRMSPSVFIPLFERNGLIRKLDRYLWREAAEQMRRWREHTGIVVPVSVNVSRIDVFAAEFPGYLFELTDRNRIDPENFCIEVTESAYTEESGRLIERIGQLQKRGFRIEMDDFGSGYSSLNMLTELPIDVLKLDMRFIRSMESNKKSARMVELMVDIARHLQVPVIAEGVETKEQFDKLRAIGCNMIQGYYFSKPVPPEEFEKQAKGVWGK